MKSLLTILCSLSFLLVTAQVPSGMVAYYPFNGNVNDSTGLGGDGVVVNGPLQYGCGVVGSAAYFDGSGVYIDLLGNINNLFNDTTDHTVALFIRNPNESVQQSVIDKRTICSHLYQGWNIRMNYQVPKYSPEFISNSRSISRSVPFFSSDCWVHFVVTKQGADITVYRNGVLVGTAVLPPSYDYQNNATLRVGNGACVGVDGTQVLNSPIDELMFYDRALNASEVNMLYSTLISGQSIVGVNIITDTICVNEVTQINLTPIVCLDSIVWYPNTGVVRSGLYTFNVSPSSTTNYTVVKYGGVFCTDSQFVNVVVEPCLYCDTIYVTDTTFVWDTTYLDTVILTTYDTIRMFDTLWITNYLTDTLVLRTDTLYTDTVFNITYDTLLVSDTLFIPNYITDTIVTIDTVYNDTVTFTITDTILSPGLSCTDTIYVMVPDTLLMRDTAIVLDTLYIIESIVVTDTTALLPQEVAIYIPNAFSPNNDGENDVFRIYGKGITVLELKVFDRWGELVFQSTDADPFWDGSLNGVLCNPDVFVYYVSIEASGVRNVIRRKGSITLLR